MAVFFMQMRTEHCTKIFWQCFLHRYSVVVLWLWINNQRKKERNYVWTGLFAWSL